MAWTPGRPWWCAVALVAAATACGSPTSGSTTPRQPVAPSTSLPPAASTTATDVPVTSAASSTSVLAAPTTFAVPATATTATVPPSAAAIDPAGADRAAVLGAIARYYVTGVGNTFGGEDVASAVLVVDRLGVLGGDPQVPRIDPRHAESRPLDPEERAAIARPDGSWQVGRGVGVQWIS